MFETINSRSLAFIVPWLVLSACDDGSSTPDGSSRAGGLSAEESVEEPTKASAEESFDRLYIPPSRKNVDEGRPDSLSSGAPSLDLSMFGGAFPDTRVECSMFVIDDQYDVVASSSQEFDVPFLEEGESAAFEFGVGGAGNGTTANLRVQEFGNGNVVLAVSYSFEDSPSAITSNALAVIPAWRLLLPSNDSLVNGVVLTAMDAPTTLGAFDNIEQVSFGCGSLGM